MDVGIPTLIEMKSVEEAACFASIHGFSFVELNMNLPWCTLESLRKINLKGLSDANGVYFTIHADENLFFCDFSDRIADAHLQNVLDAIELSKETNIALINFHMSRGVYFTLPGEKVYLFDRYRDFYFNRICHFRKACSEKAGNDVTLCIENTGISEEFVWQGIDMLLDSPSFSLTWDLGHDYTAASCDSPLLMSRKNRICHIHLHDATRKDCHLPLGNGDMDIDAMLSSVSPNRMVLEVKTLDGISASVPWLKKRHYI